jgi:hypothetical protein
MDLYLQVGKANTLHFHLHVCRYARASSALRVRNVLR